MPRFEKLQILLIAPLLLCVLCAAAAAQESAEQLFAEAAKLRFQGAHDDDIVPVLEKISKDYPLTEHDAQSRLQIARWLAGTSREEEMLGLFQSLKSDFAGQKWGYAGEYGLLEYKCFYEKSLSIEEYLDGVDQLARDLEGVSIYTPAEEVDFHPLSFATELEQRDTLEYIYAGVASDILRSQREDDALLDLALLNSQRARLLFRHENSPSTSQLMLTRVIQVREGGRDDLLPSRDPEVTNPIVECVKLPSLTSRLAKFDITDGNIEQGQVDLSTLEVLVDGQSSGFSTRLDIATEYTEERHELFHLQISPEAGWEPGEHHIQIKVSDFYKNTTEVDYRFTVSGIVQESSCLAILMSLLGLVSKRKSLGSTR